MTRNTGSPDQYQFSTVEETIDAVSRGEVVIVADDEDRENEGDFVCAAEKVTPEIINFMATVGRGLVCLTLAPEYCKKLDLVPLNAEHCDPGDTTAFTVSIDASRRFGVTTGISAQDRAKTVQVVLAADARPEDLRRPGHVFPLQARPGGVLERVGQTEASVDLAKLAGLKPAGVLCEVLNADGTMARRNDLFEVAREHNLKFVTVAQLIEYRKRTEQKQRAEAPVLTPA